jgi:hypothetical protein
LSNIAAGNQVVQEILLEINHSDQLSWLLPGVKPTKKFISVAMVSVSTFNENSQIISKRVYWDQGSVLRQAGVLPNSLYCRSNSSEVVLPIMGSNIVNAFKGKLKLIFRFKFRANQRTRGANSKRISRSQNCSFT